MPCVIEIALTIELTFALSLTFTKEESRRNARLKSKVISPNFYGPGDGTK